MATAKVSGQNGNIDIVILIRPEYTRSLQPVDNDRADHCKVE